jgi:hypothetical protein
MTTKPEFRLSSLEGMTKFAPLIALGFACREQDSFSPIFSRLTFPKGMHIEHPENALMTLWVSLLSGCRSVSQINTAIRPDLTLAQAWGQTRFIEQSTVARILDQIKAGQVEQLREGVEHVYNWLGQALNHDWAEPLLVDIDLTGLPSSSNAEGSTKGYFSEKKEAMDANFVALQPLNMMKVSLRCSIQAIL